MKNLFSLLIFISVLIICKQETKNFRKIELKKDTVGVIKSKDAVNTLKEYYFKFYGSDKTINDRKLLQKYVSERVLKRIDSLTANPENLILDYDPFIKGQDYDGNAIRKTLKIERLQNENEYRVSFSQFGTQNEKYTDIDLQLKKGKKNNFVIDAILNDEYLNFNKNSKKNEHIKFYVLDSAKLQLQKYSYKISVLEKNENKNKDNVQHNSNPIILFKGNQKISENDNLIFSYNDNCPADGFQRIVSKNNYFTIEQTYCKDFLFAHSYTTFKVNENGNIILYKYGEEYNDRSNPDKDIKSITKTSKDFGDIKFENVTENFLHNLIQN